MYLLYIWFFVCSQMFKCWRARFVLLPLNLEATKKLLEEVEKHKYRPDDQQLSDDEPGEPYSELPASSDDDPADESAGSDSAESDPHDKVLCSSQPHIVVHSC